MHQSDLGLNVPSVDFHPTPRRVVKRLKKHESEELALDFVDDVSTFTAIDRALINLLRDYRTMPRQISILKRRARGDDLTAQPSVTAHGPDEDDEKVLERLKTDIPTPQQEQLAQVVGQYVVKSDFGLQHHEHSSGSKIDVYRYATYTRVADQLVKVETDNQEHDELIQHAYVMLREAADPEERVDLTGIERLAIRREKEIQRAREQLAVLLDKYRYISEALQVVADTNESWFRLLWYQYVECKTRDQVCDLLGENGTSLTLGEHRERRRKALSKFGDWIPDWMKQTD